MDCTSYQNQVRQTHNGEGTADPAEVSGPAHMAPNQPVETFHVREIESL